MARLLFGITPIDGHVAPMVTIAAELVRRGHEVRAVTGGRFLQQVRAVGAIPVRLPPEADYDVRDLNASFPARRGKQGLSAVRFDIEHLFERPIPFQYRAIEMEIDSQRPAVLVVDQQFCAAAALVAGSPRWAERPGVVSVGVGPLYFMSPDVPPPGVGLPPLPGTIGRVRNRVLNFIALRILFARHQRLGWQMLNQILGLHRRQVACANVFDWPSCTDRHLQLTVAAFENPRSDMPTNVVFTGPVLPRAVESPRPPWLRELDESRPVVLVTQGTMDNDDLDRLVGPTLRGLAHEDVTVIATTGGAPVSALGPLPSNARAEVFLPFADVMDRVDVFVTNGGYGGVHFALRHGVPLVVAGNTEDKPEIAARVAWAGVGVNLRTGPPRPTRIAAAVGKVLNDPAYRERASRLAADMAASDGTNLAADHIEAIAAGH